MEIKIYTDGACVGNPGPGGWAAIIVFGDEKKELFGGEKITTNNRMELTAAIKALQHFKNSEELILVTDSKYVKDGIQSWMANWKKNGWKTVSKKPVKNKELWLDLDSEITKHNINWEWVKGHTGDIYNEKADSLARRYIEEN